MIAAAKAACAHDARLHYSERARVVHRKSFVEGLGHSCNPGLFVDISWNGGPVGKLLVWKTNRNKNPETFAELYGRYV